MPGIFEKIEKLKPVYDMTYKITLTLCKLLLIGDIAITSYSVLGRYVSFVPNPSWSEEVVLTFMAYIAVLSAALALRDGAHIRMTAFDRFLPAGLLKVSDLLADLAVCAFSLVLMTAGMKYALAIGARASYTSLTWLSKFWLYFPIPLAGAAMIIFELEAIFNHIRAFWDKEEKV